MKKTIWEMGNITIVQNKPLEDYYVTSQNKMLLHTSDKLTAIEYAVELYNIWKGNIAF